MRELNLGTGKALLLSLALLAYAGPGSAETFDLDLDTATGESFTAVGTTQGHFTFGTSIPVELTDIGGGMGIVDFDFSPPGLPDVEFVFPDETFEFTIIPGNEFSLSIDLESGQINENLTDPPVTLRVERFQGSSSIPVSSYDLDLAISTGTVTLNNCQGNQSRTGEPIDPETFEVLMRGLVCLPDISEPLTVQFMGTLPIPVPEPHPMFAALTALLAIVGLKYMRPDDDPQ